MEEARIPNIVLAGFMGAGKSTVGRLLADHLRWPFIDTDEEIITRFGLTIPEIFAQHGEEGFRRFESIICQSVATASGHVIATGGGMLLNPGNRQLLEATGLIVYLHAEPDDIRQRLGSGEGRPLAWGWEFLYEERLPQYETLPYRVETGGKTPQAIAEEIIALWRQNYR